MLFLISLSISGSEGHGSGTISYSSLPSMPGSGLIRSSLIEWKWLAELITVANESWSMERMVRLEIYVCVYLLMDHEATELK